MATHSSILAWRSPWTEEPGRLQSIGLQRVGHDLATKQPPPVQQERNSNPLQYSCLEYSMNKVRSLAGFSPWVTNSQTTKKLPFIFKSARLHRWFIGKKKNPHDNAGDDVSLTPRSGRSPGREHGNPLQYSCLDNPVDREAYGLQPMGSQKSWTRLCN